MGKRGTPAEQFLANKFGEQAWATAPEEYKTGWINALSNAPEKIGQDAVDFTQSQLGTATKFGKAAVRGFSQAESGVSKLLGDNLGEAYWNRVGGEANREIYQPDKSDGSTWGDIKHGAKMLGQGAVEMTADPYATSAMMLTGGLTGLASKALLAEKAAPMAISTASTALGRFGQQVERGVQTALQGKIGSQISNPYARSLLVNGLENSAGLVGYDAAQNIIEGTNHNLGDSALIGGAFGILGTVASRLMKGSEGFAKANESGKTFSAREQAIKEKEQLAVIEQGKQDEIAKAKLEQQHTVDRANGFNPNEYEGKPIDGGFNPNEQAMGDIENIYRQKEGFNPSEPSLQPEAIKQEMYAKEDAVAKAKMDEIKQAQNEARLKEEIGTGPKPSVSGATSEDMARLEASKSIGETPVYNKANPLAEDIAPKADELTPMVEKIKTMKEAGLPVKEMESYFKDASGNTDPLFKQALEEHKVISEYEKSLQKTVEPKEVLAPMATTPRHIHEELKSHPEYDNVIQQAELGKPKPSTKSMFDKIEEVKTTNVGDVVNSEDAYNKAMQDAMAKSKNDLPPSNLSKTNAKLLKEGKPTKEALAQLKQDLEARTASNASGAEATRKSLLDNAESDLAFATTKEERILAMKSKAKLNSIDTSTAKGQAQITEFEKTMQIDSIKEVTGATDKLANDLYDSITTDFTKCAIG